MAENKTQPTDASVTAFLDAVEDETRRSDARRVLELMRDVTGEEPRMWGPSIVGFGDYHYRYESGREGDWFLTGFAPRKANLVLYIMSGFPRHAELMERLGKHRTGKSCLYVNRFDDLDLDVLRELIRRSVEHVADR
ncbi:MAG: DUF1801 domain-containing protein [Gemmatimonadales bacterium]